MKPIDSKEQQKMLDLAYEAMEHAYVPYSSFRVGACLKASSGKYYLGCNIENAAYTPTNCAERTAFFKAVYDGERDFDGIAIVCSGENPAYPCGVCRQVMNEFCDRGMHIVCANSDRSSVVVSTLAEMLPNGFGPKDLL